MIRSFRLGVACLFCALFVVLLGVTGCANSQTGGSASISAIAAQKQTSAEPMAASVSPSGSSAASSGEMSTQDYKIAPRDVLQVTVFQVADLNRTVQVDNTGFITLPLINGVHVGGMTMRQAQDEITARLGQSYLRSPQVTLSLVKSGQRVTINGAVKNAQVLTVDGELTLSQAVALAGGTNDVANPERIHVARVFGGHVSDDIYNLSEIQSGKANDPSLRGGDIVVVEDSQARVAFKNVKDLLPFAVIGSLLSDVHLKTDIRALYVRVDGITVYRYRYKWSDLVYVGVIAQNVQRIRPDAVSRGPDGFLRVNYRRIGLEMQTCKVWMAMRGPSQQAIDCFASPIKPSASLAPLGRDSD